MIIYLSFHLSKVVIDHSMLHSIPYYFKKEEKKIVEIRGQKKLT